MYNINQLKFINESSIKIKESEIIITSPANTDYFNSPVIKDNKVSITNTSPYYYEDVTGDFTVRVKVKNNFTHNYDAGAIFIHESDQKWIKLAFEETDFDTTAIVSVITNNTSDDANGVNLEEEWVWLMVSRVDDTFALHYSLDGNNYTLVRIFRLEMGVTVKVGITAQSPNGPNSEKVFSDLEITDYKLSDLRSGRLL